MADNHPDVVSILQRHLDPCIEMLEQIIERCPEELWIKADSGAPLWQHVYHTLVGPDFWFRPAPQAPFHFSTLNKNVSPDLDKPSADFLTRDELRQYIQRTKKICTDFVAGMDDPTEPSALSDVFTRMDLVLMQIRHFQHHVGYCNARLREHGIPGTPWMGYGE